MAAIAAVIYWLFMRKKKSNIAAFLMMIRHCEGTDGKDGYRTLFSYQYFDDYSKHPNILIKANGYNSTAAGAYQINYPTWLDIQKRISLPDFSPASQDAAAIQLIKMQGAYNDVLAGNFEAAVNKCAARWASLPGSPYSQPTKALATAKQYYLNAGGQLA